MNNADEWQCLGEKFALILAEKKLCVTVAWAKNNAKSVPFSNFLRLHSLLAHGFQCIPDVF